MSQELYVGVDLAKEFHQVMAVGSDHQVLARTFRIGRGRSGVQEYLDYYHHSRTHLGLEKDCPESRPIEPPDKGPIRLLPVLGGLHHCYTRRAA